MESVRLADMSPHRSITTAAAVAGLLLLIPSILIAQVDTAWVRRYDGPAHQDDQIIDIAVDSAGNVYSVGQSDSDPDTGRNWDIVAWKLSPAGESLWLTTYDYSSEDAPWKLAVGHDGAVYVAAYSAGRFTVVKFAPTGQLDWVKRPYAGAGWAADAAISPDGDVIVAGGTAVSGHGYDCVLVKYRPNGDTAWARLYDSLGDEDYANCLAVDSAGNSYIGGITYEGGIGGKFLVIKYDSAGNRQWVTAFDGPAVNGGDQVNDIAVDNRGNVYFTGKSEGIGTGYWDYATGRLDAATGETLWVRRYDGAAHREDMPTCIALDSVGNVYVTGWCISSAPYSDCATLSYDPDGTLRWLALYDGPTHGSDGASALALGGGSHLYVTGGYRAGNSQTDMLTISYTLSGDTEWLRGYNGPANRYDWATCVAATPGGSDGCCIGGYSETYGGATTDAVVIKYSVPPGVSEDRSTSMGRALSVGPNPFRKQTRVSIGAAIARSAELAIRDVAGRCILTAHLEPGGRSQALVWDGRDAAGRQVPPGVYVISVTDGGPSDQVKVIKLQ